MTTLPENSSVAIDKLESAITEMESHLESVRAERDEAKARQVELEFENANLHRELNLAREQQKASAGILSVISSSVADTNPVFESILSSIKHLFDGEESLIFLSDEDGLLRIAAARGASAEAARERFPIPIEGTASELAIRERRLVRSADVQNDPDVPIKLRETARRVGQNYSMAIAPMLWEGDAIGTIFVGRSSMVPFTDRECELLNSFANQAVIAIQNARLFNETREALERQTATAEILKVIASSPSDVQPVFEAIASNAKQLLGGFSTTVLHFVGDELHLVAYTPTSSEADEALKSSFPRKLAEFPTFALVRNGETIQFADTEADEVPEANRELGRLRGFRSVLFTPLMNRGAAVGMISVTREAPGAFASHHVQLLQTFAAQAVIAIENVRLFNETREALERQTATAEILRVIASSPSDVLPVFEAIVGSAKRLLGGFSAAVFRFIDGIAYLQAITPTNPAADEIMKNSFPRPIADFQSFAMVQAGQTVQTPDTEALPDDIRDIARARGFRSMLLTPLLREGTPIGLISVTRVEPGPFSAHFVQLLQTFADQAVIAIENVRLFDEVQAKKRDLEEALTYQTGSANILSVIAASPTDVRPVLQAIVESACDLCEAYDCIAFLRDGDYLRFSAHHGPIPMDFDKWPINRKWVTGRSVVDKRPVHVHDLMAEGDEFPDGREMSARMGHRTMVAVPLLRDGNAIGSIILRRNEVNPFSDKQVNLLQTFADQAVIAIGNVRLFEEVQAKTRDLEEALTYQTGSANILKVIASSPTDINPVFHAIVESACELCDAYDAVLRLKSGDNLRFSAHHGPISTFRNERPINRHWTAGRAILEQRPVQIDDILSAEGEQFPEARELAMRQGHRTILSVPLLREGESLGTITLRRTEVHPFSDKQITLLQTFADQAVIAIGNVRLFEEVQAKTHDLTESLQQQTATGEVLKVIASSPTDVQPALQAIVESACTFCDAYDAGVLLKIGNDLHFSAHHGPIPTGQEPRSISREWVVGRSVVDKVPVQVPDFQAAEAAEFPEGQRQSREQGHRCTLSVPLLREGEAIGALALRRLEPIAFSDKQIALLETFADQAVIAIGNVRMFEEVQARTRDLQEALTYQTGSANILKVIASSPTDVGPVLNAIVESACELCDANDAIVFLREGDRLSYKAHHGPIPVVFGENRAINRGYVAGRSMVDKIPVHVRDVFSEEAADFPESRELSRKDGIRSILCVPMLRENESIGAILLRRTEVHPFTDKQVALLQTFANQAVIAIGNVHLFEEVQARTRELTESLEQQTATSEVLQAISSSQGDLAPVFDAMLGKSMQLCGADFGVLNTYHGSRFHTAATYGLPPAYDEFRRRQPLDYGPGTAPALLLQGEPHVEILHLLDSEAYRRGDPNRRALVDIGGARSLLAVPLLKDKRVVGNVMIFRQEDSAFSEKQIALLKQFAAQAVIAIENARLLNELRQRTNDLSRSLDELRTAQDRLVQTEKLASLGQLTAGIAHEIKNPLNFVNNFAALSTELTEELNDALKQAEVGEKIRAEVDELTGLLMGNLEKIVQHGRRADSIVKNMLLHSREGGGEHRPSDINALVDESLNLAYHGARAEKPGFNVTLERDFDPTAGQVDLFPQEMTRVLLNLISNGFYAVTKRNREAGEPGFEPTLRASTKNLGDAVEIRIRDNGTGIPPEVREKMFNPFFTTKPAGEGTGLGLSMSHDIIVKQHGGTIDVNTEQGHFTEFRIVLPRTSNFAEESRG